MVYIDPPFATNGNFTITDGRASTISNSRNGDIAYSDKLTGKEFIEYLRERLILLKELLSEQGSIYLHIDYKIGHYVKVMMDEVFGIENFRNDITRIRRYTTVPIHAPGETENGKSNQSFKGIMPPKGRHWQTDTETLEQCDKEGLIEWSSTGNPRKIIFADEREGKRVQDVWEYKDPQYPTYPTEKILNYWI